MSIALEDIEALPGAELVIPGLADVRDGRATIEAASVLLARRRLIAAGLDVSEPRGSLAEGKPGHGLYRELLAAGVADPYSRYKAILRRIDSFARALEGWRDSTVDVDLRIEPESDEVMRRIAALKEKLDTNIEFASPADFPPELPGWRERSRFRFRTGTVEVFDYDLYSQALAKVERGFETDLSDFQSMLDSGLVEHERLVDMLDQIEPELFRFPAVNARAFREKLQAALATG